MSTTARNRKKVSAAPASPTAAAAAGEDDSKKKQAHSGGSTFMMKSIVVVLLLIISGLVALIATGAQHDPKLKAAIVEFFPEEFIFKVEDATGLSLSSRGFKRSLQEKVPQDTKPPRAISFTVHFNGDGLGAGVSVVSSDYDGMDTMIRKVCAQMNEVRKVANENPSAWKRICDPEEGARLFTHRGKRCWSFLDIAPNSRTYIVPQGVQFVWPLGKVGDMIYPEAVESPVPGKPIRLIQLSMSPRVFTVENFMSQEEMQAILDHNKDLVKPSEVGFAGWRDSTRTSSTAWDFHSWAAKKVQRRSFDLVGMEYDSTLADAVQVLRYAPKEWYKPHTDWFDEKGYDGHDPTVSNGTNRFATVFLYLTNVDAGGHTVFPLSKTHEGYNGEELVHPGTENTAGYIAQRDAEWVCNTSSTALRSEPVAGNAVLFYSQGADGELDKYSLHGGCPVIEGTKWSCNVWIWNRPKPGKEKAKDGKPSADDQSIHMQFQNTRGSKVGLYWDDGTDEMVFQVEIESGMYSPMTTYHGHRFVARDMATGKQVFDFTANDNMKGKEFVAVIN